MLKRVLLAAACLSLGACVSTKIVPIDQDSIAKLQGGTVVASKRAKGDFAAMTAGKATFGLIGAAAMISAGNKIIEENQVEDPANYISEHIVAQLASSNALTQVQADGTVATGTDVKKLAQQYSKADILVDVQTVNWSFAYFPTDWNNYRVIYSTKLRIIDTKRSKVLAEGFCARVPDQTDDAPSHEELLANGAERLKKELSTAAEYCTGELQAKVLGKGDAVAKTAGR